MRYSDFCAKNEIVRAREETVRILKVKYFELIVDIDFEEGCSIEDYELGNFDLVRYWRNGNLNGNNLFELTVDISGGSISDYLSPPISMPFVSARFREYIENYRHNIRFTDLKPCIRRSGVECNYYLAEFEESFSLVNGLPLNLDILRCSDKVAGSILFAEHAAKSMKGLSFANIAFLI